MRIFSEKFFSRIWLLIFNISNKRPPKHHPQNLSQWPQTVNIEQKGKWSIWYILVIWIPQVQHGIISTCTELVALLCASPPNILIAWTIKVSHEGFLHLLRGQEDNKCTKTFCICFLKTRNQRRDKMTT